MSSNQSGGVHKNVDRRLDPRISSRVEAVIDDVKHGKLVFIASGFSRKGAFLQRRDDATPLPAIGSVIQLQFTWPLETNIPPIRVDAKVIHQTENGVGVQFESV